MPFPTPTQEELEQVRGLRERITTENITLSPKITDVSILRFLRGVKGNVSDAYDRLIAYNQWRTEHDVDNIESQKHRVTKFQESGLYRTEGYDRYNRPIGIGTARFHDKYNRDVDDMRLLIIYCLESLLSRAIPEEERFTIVMDLHGFSLRCMDYEVVKILIHILQNHYPDTLEKIFIVDAPFLFSACWAIIRPWLDPVTAAKVTFVRRNEIQEHLDPSLLTPIA
eukprot:gene117-123_t